MDQQDTPQKYGGSIWGADLEPVNVVGNTIQEVLDALAAAAKE